MEIEKGKTAKYMRNQIKVDPGVKERLKLFNRTKKMILGKLKEEEATVPQLSDKLGMPAHEVLYYLMSLQKYGLVETARIDDDDEYFYYKIKA